MDLWCAVRRVCFAGYRNLARFHPLSRIAALPNRAIYKLRRWNLLCHPDVYLFATPRFHKV